MLFLLLFVTNLRYEGRAVPDRVFLQRENFNNRTLSLVEYSLHRVTEVTEVLEGADLASVNIAVTMVLLCSVTLAP